MSGNVISMEQARGSAEAESDTAVTYTNLLELVRLFESGQLTGLALIGTLKNGDMVSCLTGDADGDADVKEQLQLLSNR